MYVDVQTEGFSKPHDECECHKHSYTDEMLHKVSVAKRETSIYIGMGTDVQKDKSISNPLTGKVDTSHQNFGFSYLRVATPR
jgi:hypothetical protein